MQDLGIRVLLEGNNLFRLFAGLWVTFRMAMISMAFSMTFGFFLGLMMTLKSPVIRIITRFYLNFIRIMPPLVLLFMVYFGTSKTFGLNLSGELAAILVFSLWGTAEMGDLVRSALISIPKHQYDSGKTIGLSRLQIFLYIIVPQTIKRLLPNAINLTTRMIKTTSLVALIGVVEVLKVGQQIIESARYTIPSAAIWIYGTIFFLYFAICYPISLIARRLEKRWSI